MVWHREGDYGSVREIQSYPDGQGTRVTRKFLSSIVVNFASWNTDFWEYAGFFPVMFRERQISGGIFKAILDSGAQALPEPPIKRKRRGVPEQYGWADFVAYLGDTVWFLEVKHTWYEINRHKKTESDWLMSEWDDAYEKIKSLGRTAVGEWTWQQHVGFGATLHVVLVYQQHKLKDKVQPVDERGVVDYIKSLNRYLNPKPNWIWLWSLHHKLQEAQQYNTKWENYPAVCFFVYLKRLNLSNL